MAFYTMTFDNVSTNNAADAYKTIAALIVADTAGHRMRLRALHVGPADDTPQDKNYTVQVKRIGDVSEGGAGTAPEDVAAADMGKKDPDSVASIISGKRGLFTAEPTVYDAEPLFMKGVNGRGSFIKEWSAEEAPVATRDQLLGVLATPRSAAALQVSGAMDFEVF